MKLKLFIFSLFTLLVFVAYQKYSEYSVLKSVDSYESCITAKGSIIQESYPATCVTRLGDKFRQPIPNTEDTNLPKVGNYTNEFIIKVPTGWKKNNSNTPVYTNYNDQELLKPPEYIEGRDEGKYKIDIVTYETGSFDLLLEQYKKSDMDPNAKFIESDTILDGQKATLIQEISEFGNITSALIQNPKNGHAYILSFYNFGDNKKLLNQILSTFKFTN